MGYPLGVRAVSFALFLVGSVAAAPSVAAPDGPVSKVSFYEASKYLGELIEQVVKLSKEKDVGVGVLTDLSGALDALLTAVEEGEQLVVALEDDVTLLEGALDDCLGQGGESCDAFATFGVGVYGSTTCASRCANEGGVCIGIGTNDRADNGLYNTCGGASNGLASDTAEATCHTVMGGNGCSEWANCLCNPCYEEFVTFGVGVYGTTTCARRCAAEGGFCLGVGTDDEGRDGHYNTCNGASNGLAFTTAPATCQTVFGGNGCSEWANCRCLNTL